GFAGGAELCANVPVTVRVVVHTRPSVLFGAGSSPTPHAPRSTIAARPVRIMTATCSNRDANANHADSLARASRDTGPDSPHGGAFTPQTAQVTFLVRRPIPTMDGA